MQKSILKITYAGLLIALSVVLSIFTNTPLNFGGIGIGRLNLGFIPIILAGLLLGPLYGGLVGAIADILSYILNPMGGVFFPGFTLTNIIVGVLPGISIFKFKRNLISIGVSIFITVILVTFINTIWLVWIFIPGINYMIALIPRLVFAFILCFGYTFFVFTIKKVVDKTMLDSQMGNSI